MYKHYLKFISLGQDFLYEITEPVGFDVANFVVEQNANRYARDISYGNEKADLTFYDIFGTEQRLTEQVINVQGQTSYTLDMGLSWILESHNRFGFESKIEYHLFKDNVSFVVGLLDCANPNTDGFSFYGCNIIQDNNIADYKKHQDTVLDMFGKKDVKNNTITPVGTVNVLRKSQSKTNKSKWNPYELNLIDDVASNVFFTFNPIIEKSEIDYTLTNGNYCSYKVNNAIGWKTETMVSFQSPVTSPDYNPMDTVNGDNHRLLKAKKIISDIYIKVHFNGSVLVKSNFAGVTDIKLVYCTMIGNSDFETKWVNGNYFKVFELALKPDGALPFQDFDFNETVKIPGVININDYLFGFWTIIVAGNPILPRYIRTYFSISICEIELIATETAINTVSPMVRYIDMMRQCSKNINNLPIVAPRFDVGGEFYNNFCFNRALISAHTSYPFNTKFKEILGSVEEVNGDYEINQNNIFVGQYQDFYENVENGVFQQIPSSDFKENWNKRFLINIFKYGYKIYEKNRLSTDSGNAIHTEAEYIVPNLQVENKKDISNELIRDPFSQQAIVDLEISKPLTADENDDKVYIVDVIDLPSGSFNEIIATLGLRTVNGNYQILNREIGQDLEQSVINWTVIGINVGDTVYMNGLGYVVLSITREILELTGNSGIPDQNLLMKIKYYYNGVLYQTRTNEGFTNAPLNFQNLKYSIRRNLKHFESYLNTCVNFVRNGIIRNNYLRNNSAIETRLTTETVNLKEKSDLQMPELQPRILTPKLYEIEVYASFESVLDLLEKYKTNRGFIRAIGIKNNVVKGYVQKLDYVWQTGSLKLTLEEKFENDLLVLTFANGILTVNDVIYNLSGIGKWWVMTNEHLQVFDANNIAICNPYRFNFVSLNGVIYNSKQELTDALILL